jgi:hypothetical protein
MSAEVFMPQVKRSFLVSAGLCWLALTILAAWLSTQSGFAAKLGQQIASTAAATALAVTGIGTLVQVWQRRRMRERTGPFILDALTEATAAAGHLVGAYAVLGSPVLHGFGAVTAHDAEILLRPPIDEREKAIFREWADSARTEYDRRLGLYLARRRPQLVQEGELGEDGSADLAEGIEAVSSEGSPTGAFNPVQEPLDADPEGRRFLERLQSVNNEIARAMDELEAAVDRLVEFDAPHVDRALEGVFEAHKAVRGQLLLSAPEQQPAWVILKSWLYCANVLSAALNISKGVQDCLQDTRKAVGRGQSPLERALRTSGDVHGETTDQFMKAAIIMRVHGATLAPRRSS